MSGYTIWFTGISGSGKTTIADELAKKLKDKNVPFVLLDGDVVRKTLSSDLGYSRDERNQHMTRVANVSHLINLNDVLVIACVLSPTRKIRRYARNLIDNFVEVYIKCPYEVCEKRDVKGLYEKAKKGEIKDFVGLDIPYEEPEKPEIIIETDKSNLNECVKKLLTYLEEKNIIT